MTNDERESPGVQLRLSAGLPLATGDRSQKRGTPEKGDIAHIEDYPSNQNDPLHMRICAMSPFFPCVPLFSVSPFFRVPLFPGSPVEIALSDAIVAGVCDPDGSDCCRGLRPRGVNGRPGYNKSPASLQQEPGLKEAGYNKRTAGYEGNTVSQACSRLPNPLASWRSVVQFCRATWSPQRSALLKIIASWDT